MNEQLKQMADDMLEKFKLIDKGFLWEHQLSKHFVALLLTQSNQVVNIDALKRAIDVVKENTKWYSNFRGTYRFILAGLMVQDGDGFEGGFNRVLMAESAMKLAGFKQGMHMPIAAYTLSKVADEESPQVLAQRAFGYYNDMKANHPWITSTDDYAMSVLLAKNSVSLERIEEVYRGLSQNGFYKGNELQRLSHILALSTRTPSELVEDCTLLKKRLKDEKLNLSATYYASLGLMTHIQFENPQSLNDCIELSKGLMSYKKFKWLGKGMNVLLASALVSNLWITESSQTEANRALVGITIESLIAAQTAALIAATSAAAAASSAAATS